MTKFYAPFLASVVRFTLTFRTSHIVCAAIFLAVLSHTSLANAVTLFWDANSSLAGTGSWDTTGTMDWRTTNTAGAPDSTWTPNDGTVDATFGGNPGAGVAGSGLGGTNGVVTASGTINVDSIILAPTVGNYSISGGTLNITNPNSSFVMNDNTSGSSRAQIVASVVAGTNITVVAQNGASGVNSFLTLGAPGSGVTNTFTGDLIFGGPSTATLGFSQININNPTALPSTATVRMQRNLCQLIFGGGGVSGTAGYTKTFNNNINLNDGGSTTLTQSIGAFDTTYNITLGGVISGNANLVFQLGNGGGNGLIVLANHETYTGSTNLNSNTAAVIRQGISDALPVGTTLIMNRGSAFDMAGFSQRVGGINNTGAAVADITNSGGTQSTLTIDGNVTGSFPGNIGPGGQNIAVVLAPTNTGSLTLTRVFGTGYSGVTTIGGGKLIAANNPGGTATGTGPVAVNSGGTLGGGGGVGAAGTGTITVASGGHIAPSGVVNNGTTVLSNPIGTLTALGNVTLGSGSRLDIDLGTPGTSDRLDMSGTTLTVPAAAASIGVNLGDPAGGAAGNGTYRILSFPVGQYSGTNASQFFTSAPPSPNSLNGATITYQLADDTDTNQNGNPSAATRVNMVVTGGPNALVWTGANNGTWDVGTPTGPSNFSNLSPGGATTFAGNDNVTFDDTGANTNSITVAAGGVQPNVVTINNSTATYSFSGGDIKGSSVGGTGGLVLGGTGAVTIGNKYTAVGPIISNKSGAGTATINGAITAATSVTVNGGTVTLSGANTYTGNNTVNNGTLTASGAAATFGTGNVTVNAGTVANPSSAAILAGVANAIADSATLTLLGGGAANTADTGFINLGTGINEKVASLVLGATTYTSGTFGATGSGATNIFDEYFLGGGLVTVGPAGLPGDYNNDGKVNAADYVIWRKGGSPNPNSIGDYNTWRANFGNGGAGSGTGLGGSSAVPEPASCAILLMGCIALLCIQRNKSR